MQFFNTTLESDPIHSNRYRARRGEYKVFVEDFPTHRYCNVATSGKAFAASQSCDPVAALRALEVASPPEVKAAFSSDPQLRFGRLAWPVKPSLGTYWIDTAIVITITPYGNDAFDTTFQVCGATIVGAHGESMQTALNRLYVRACAYLPDCLVATFREKVK